MCRGKRTCSLLGSPEEWSREAPLAPPTWLRDEIESLAKAVRVAAAGDMGGARARLQTLRSNEARDWFVEHAQVSGIHRARVLGLARVDRPKQSRRKGTPAAVKRRVWERDRYHCRYCGLPMVDERVRIALQEVVGTNVISWGDTNAARHGIAFAARPEYDHVHPMSAGGADDESNLVTSCPGCNYGKDRFTLEEIGLDDPRLRPPVTSEWDGLTSLLPALNSVARHVRPRA